MRLVVKQGTRVVNEFQFSQSSVSIGRQARCDVVLADRTISKHGAGQSPQLFYDIHVIPIPYRIVQCCICSLQHLPCIFTRWSTFPFKKSFIRMFQ